MTKANVTPTKTRGMMMLWSILNGWFNSVALIWDSSNGKEFLCLVWNTGLNLMGMVG